MIDYPKTLEEARKWRYSAWFRPPGEKYIEGRCAHEAYIGWAKSHQCPRKNGYGADNLYCKQHAKILGMM